jgi:DNA-binding GntR family transcriptional regulator
VARYKPAASKRWQRKAVFVMVDRSASARSTEVSAGGQPSGDGDADVYWGLSGKAAFVCAELERRLTAGVYRFGDTLPTADLVREFAISRAPLTAALNQLRNAGYLQIVPQVGSQVITPSDQQVRDFYVMFSRVEGGMARFAAERRSEKDIAFLQEVCALLTEASVNPRTIVLDHYLELLVMYHGAVHDIARSPLEAYRARSYRQIATFFLRNGLPHDIGHMFEITNKARPAVTAAIVRGNPQEAEPAMVSYILRGSGIE